MPLKSIYKAPWFVKAVFVISFFLIFFVAGVTYKNMDDLSESTDLVEKKYEIAIELEQILSYLKDAETGQRGFVIVKDSSYLMPYLLGRENINNSFAELKGLIDDETEQQRNLIELRFLIDNCLANYENVQEFILKRQNNINSPEFRPLFARGKLIMDQIRAKIRVMLDVQNKKLEKYQEEHTNNLRATPIFLYSLIILSLLLMIGAYYKIASNLKKLKKTNQALEIFKESTNQSEIVSKHGNWTWNIEEDRFTYSDNLYRLLGEEPHSFKPTIEKFMEFVHPEDVEKLSAQVARMKEEQNLPFIHYRVIHKNGNIKHLKAYGKVVINNEGEHNLLGTTTDITDEIESFRALEERNLELERNNKELSAFNHVASHDLQEPLRKIQTFLSRLEDKEEGNFSESGLKYMSRIKNAASRMRLLIDDLLQFSRTNKADKVFEVSNINLLLEAAKQDLAEVISQENATINADTFPVLNVIPFQMQQLFANLIGNSLKYKSVDRAPEINITYAQVKAETEEMLTKAKKDSYHKITFKDNGIGFDNEYAKKIFVLFSRLHNKSDYSGTGIGLSICKKIIENHKGFIFADGEVGVGATFTVYLPIV
ncbi:Phytochrome-like protein cph1 [Kordia antarctica]|uniref:histidine kinase n=1 Tax=Kordia antarctica TaxID=1218801 RepID=A0A7L4ZEU7_9FLAO|nr:CHASE3 domain-containing protein [Kordia antarctica]QHI34981.1 Phytochrome-like protein cph1 [Kordia antarctica]